MKPRTLFFIAVVGLMVLCAWTTQPTTDISKAKWLIGTWENKTQRGSIYETWNKINNNEFSGMSYIIKENDTIVFENIQLLQKQDGLYYIPIVNHQNNGLAIHFTTKTASDTQLIFENPNHDFPQVISYTKITSDSVVAEISGMKSGEQHKQIFPMRRVK